MRTNEETDSTSISKSFPLMGEDNEVLEKRTVNSETYQLEDGSYECIIYSENKYFLDDNSLQKIDNTICAIDSDNSQYLYTNKANIWSVYFSKSIDDTILIQSPDASLSISFDSKSNFELIPKGDKRINEIGGCSLYGDSSIMYSNILPSTHFVYTVINTGIKEYIVLENEPIYPDFHFRFKCNDSRLSFYNEENGIMVLRDSKGKDHFYIDNLFVIDSNGNVFDCAQNSIKQIDDSTFDYCIDLSSLQHIEQSITYPIVIDPSIMVTGSSSTYDSYVSSKNPTSNYYTNNYLRTGRDDDYHIRRSYIKFDIPSSLAYENISNAYINIKYYSGIAPTSVSVKRVTGSWSSSSITWNNKPGFTNEYASTLSLYSNNWYRANVTNMIKRWIYDGYTNYGFLLIDSTESGTNHWTTFYSSDAPSPNKPELHINYTTTRDARLIGVTVSGHDHYTCLSNSVVYISNCSIGSVYTHSGAFTSSQVNNYLDYNQNCLFASRSHGGEIIEGGVHKGTKIILNDSTPEIAYKSTEIYSDFSNMNLIIFIGCNTAKGSTNLPSVCVNHNAKTAVGFTESIDCDIANAWTELFFEYLSNDYTVQGACSTLASFAVYSGGNLDKYRIYGYNYTKIK